MDRIPAYLFIYNLPAYLKSQIEKRKRTVGFVEVCSQTYLLAYFDAHVFLCSCVQFVVDRSSDIKIILFVYSDTIVFVILLKVVRFGA